MKRSVLVTGCTGLVGHGITLSLIERGYDVWGTSRAPIRSRHAAFHAAKLDLAAPESLEALRPVLEQVEVVIHNAARLPVQNEHAGASWNEFFSVNVSATRRLLSEAAACGVAQFIYISASPIGLLDDTCIPLREETPYLPRNAYATSKACAEVICRHFDRQANFPVCILRFPAPYGYLGSSTAVLPKFVRSVRAGEPITLWGSGNRLQAFTFVEDIGQACAKALETSARGVFQIAGPEVLTMNQLAAAVLKTFPDSGSRVVYDDKPDPEEHRSVNISVEKARRVLAYEPRYTLLQGLEKIARADGSIMMFEYTN
jgi:nucleoside-diphosphate-sugar epimerase